MIAASISVSISLRMAWAAVCIVRSSAGRRAAWRTSVEQAFGAVIPKLVTAVRHTLGRRPPAFHHG